MSNTSIYCCCNTTPPPDLTCPSGAIFDACDAFPVACSPRWGVCVSGESGDLAPLNTNPGQLMTEYAAGQYRYTEAGVRKYELDITTPFPGSGNSNWELRAYLWDGAAWTLERTANNTISWATGYSTFGFVVPVLYKIWAIDPWYTDAVNVTYSGVAPCFGADYCYIYDDGATEYYARIVTFSLPGGALVLSASAPFGLCAAGGRCPFVGVVGSVTIKVYANAFDCADDLNMVEEITLDITAVCCVGPRYLLAYAFVSELRGGSTENFFSHLVFASEDIFANDWSCAGETKTVATEIAGDCLVGGPAYCVATGGTMNFTIPSF